MLQFREIKKSMRMTDPSVEPRRAALLSLLSLCVASPAALAQPRSKTPRIGVLEGMPPEVFPARFAAFKEGLRAAGYADGTVELVYRSANGKLDGLPALAAELVRLDVDLILAATTAAAVAARDATRKIPIVFAVVADPIGARLVESLPRPGGNLTGVSTRNTDVAQKRLQLLGGLLNGKASRVAVVFNPGDPSNVVGAKLIGEAGRTLGFEVSPVEVGSREDLERAFVRMRSDGLDGVVVAAGALTDTHGRFIAELAARTRIPAMYGAPEFVEAGGLISYSASFSSNYRRAAAYVDRILRGTSPALLPVEQSSELELVINRSTAAALGLAIPPSLQVQARFVD
ncbi:MAG: ABC transporter substrate-binding protein [Burkholderiales bacterium]|nr:ABC transporter substrate-binding protein [Burkholderiales bacterium]